MKTIQRLRKKLALAICPSLKQNPTKEVKVVHSERKLTEIQLHKKLSSNIPEDIKERAVLQVMKQIQQELGEAVLKLSDVEAYEDAMTREYQIKVRAFVGKC